MLGLFVTIQTVALLYTQVHAFPCHDWIILNNSVLPIRHTVRILLRKVNNCSLSVSKSLIKKNVNRWKKNLTPTLTILCIAFCNLTYSIPLSKDLKKTTGGSGSTHLTVTQVFLSLQPLRHLQDLAGLYVGFTFVLKRRILKGNTEVVCESLINLK